MSCIQLSQQKVKTLQDALDKAMKIEGMASYLQYFKVDGPSTDSTIMGLHN